MKPIWRIRLNIYVERQRSLVSTPCVLVILTFSYWKIIGIHWLLADIIFSFKIIFGHLGFLMTSRCYFFFQYVYYFLNISLNKCVSLISWLYPYFHIELHVMSILVVTATECSQEMYFLLHFFVILLQQIMMF